jgi:xanthine dehydrogenase accessory factor
MPGTESVAAVVLAAGSATRMGRNKMLLELGGESLVRRSVRAALAAGLSPVVVVLGHEAEKVQGELGGLPCLCVVNPDHAKGPGSSLRVGVGHVGDAGALVLSLADMPFVTAAMMRSLVARHRETRAELVVSRYGSIEAPPHLFERSLFDELRNGPDDRCAKPVIRRHLKEASVLSWPEGSLQDIDRPQDYEQVVAELALQGPAVRRNVLQLAADLTRRGEPFALATVVGRRAPSSAQIGDMAVITADGKLQGWLGGSCTQETVVEEARRALDDGRPRYVSLDPDPGSTGRPGVTVHLMTCHSGGQVEIHVQPVLPPPVLLVYGASPIARALARLAHAMGYVVHAADPGADASVFPEATSVSAAPEAMPIGRRTAPLFAVVATQGQWDEAATLAALGHRPDYLGVVSSPRRFAEMRPALAARASDADLARIKNPAGLDLKAKVPEEIALSILAEIVKVARERGVSPEAPPPAAPDVRDPVCGMSVRVEGARHRAEYQGREFFFCCGGCRERFLATPEKYLAVAAQP